MVSQQFPPNSFDDPAAEDPAAGRSQGSKQSSAKSSPKNNPAPPGNTSQSTAASDGAALQPARITPFVITVIGAIALAAIILTVLDPSDDNGISLWIGVVGVPALAAMIAIGILGRQSNRFTVNSTVAWWMFGILPLGILLACVPMVIQHPDYFEADNIWSVLGFFLMMTLVIFIGYLLGALAWLLILVPLSFSFIAVRDLIQGKPFSATMAILPVLLLSTAAIIIVGPMTLRGLPPGRTALGEAMVAILGIPGDYVVAWEGGLWILRGLFLLIVVCIIWMIQLGKARKKAAQIEQGNSKSQPARS